MDVRPGYKQTEVGVIPEDWEVRQFSDHFRIYAGGDVPKHSLSQIQSEIHPYPIFSNALQNNGLYGYTAARRSNASSITVTARGYLGNAEYRDQPFFPIVRLLVLEPTGQLDARYTTYAVNDRVKFSIESTGVPQLTAPQVGKYSVAAPPTEKEQRAIAAALSDVDALLDGLDRLIAKKRDLKHAAMQQLLTGQTRLPGFTGEWGVKRLGNVVQLRKERIDPRRSGFNDFCIEMEHIEQGTGCLVGHTSTTESSSLKSVFSAGDVLFGKLRAYLRKYWLADQDGVCSTEIWVLMATRSSLSPAFLFQLVNTDRFIEAASLAYGTHMPRSDWNIMRSYGIHLPPLSEQTAIAAVLSDIDAELATLEARRDKTRALKQGMMQELLTGRTRLV